MYIKLFLGFAKKSYIIQCQKPCTIPIVRLHEIYFIFISNDTLIQ